ncbi:MAG TPA: sulfite exporter TauE/SafE family protein [Rubrivivax sp.]|nr:sulfite exporter TauE/SafE family protein [Rubrivivax sp.]
MQAPLPLLPLLWAMAVVAAAGVVRGFAGFGFSAVTVAGLSLVVSPVEIVPVAFVLEVLASVHQVPGSWRDIHARWLGWLVLGNALAIPLGLALLGWLPETPLRLLIGTLLLLATAALRSGATAHLEATRSVRLATGLASGLANGVAAIGGIMVAVLLSATALEPAAMRATLIALFLFTDLYALAWAAGLSWLADAPNVLLGAATAAWVLWMLPPMLVGIAIGQRGFAGISPASFRRRVLELLIVVSGSTIVHALRVLAA